MKTTIALVSFLVLISVPLYGQSGSINNTLGTGGLFTIKDGTQTFLTLNESNGYIGIETPDTSVHLRGGATNTLLLQTNTWDNGHYAQIDLGDSYQYMRGEFGMGITFYSWDKFNFLNAPVGIGTADPAAKLDVEDGGVLFNGVEGDVPIGGPGTRMMWKPSKSAFRAGTVLGSEWDPQNIGNYSTAIGHATMASGKCSTALGDSTFANGDYSTALGNSVSSGGHSGCLVIGDKAVTYVASNDADNQFWARFIGGYKFYSGGGLTEIIADQVGWSPSSDRNKKENFRAINGEEILSKIRLMPITEWNFKNTPTSIRYIGPMAQDFHAAFHLGGADSLSINSVCIDGVNMAAIQALEKRTAELREKTAQLDAKSAELNAKAAELAAKSAELEAVKSRLADLESRFARLERATTALSQMTQLVSTGSEQNRPRR